MATPQPSKDQILPEEIIAFILALDFMHSVDASAMHLLVSERQLTAPGWWVLVPVLLVVAYRWYRARRLSTINVVTLCVAAVSVYFWIFGLRLNVV